MLNGPLLVTFKVRAFGKELWEGSQHIKDLKERLFIGTRTRNLQVSASSHSRSRFLWEGSQKMMTFYETLQRKYGLDKAEPPNQFTERSGLALVSSMTQAYPCLLRIGKTSSKYRHFPFVQDQVGLKF